MHLHLVLHQESAYQDQEEVDSGDLHPMTLTTAQLPTTTLIRL
jgi:hypothetical protein